MSAPSQDQEQLDVITALRLATPRTVKTIRIVSASGAYPQNYLPIEHLTRVQMEEICRKWAAAQMMEFDLAKAREL